MKQFSTRLLSLLTVAALILASMPMIVATTPVAAASEYPNTHVNTGDMAADIVAVAETQAGYCEGSLSGNPSYASSNNYQKYGVWYDNNVDNIGGSYAAWCAMFVSWCANQAGIPSSIMYYHAYCPYGVNWFKNQGRFQYAASRGGSYVPKAGDIVYFAPSGSTVSSHIGIVRYVSGGYVYTIEGNTSSQNGEVNEGGGVFKKSYALSYARFYGYGTPAYETSPGSTTAEKLGTYKITASSLNVRSGAGTDYDVVGEVVNGDLVTVSELSNGWGKVTLANGVTGWCAISQYGDYIGVDALNTEPAAVWGGENLTMHTNENGSVTFANKGAEAIAVDMPLPLKIGNKTTPYLNISTSVTQGSYYFGLTQNGSGYFMMRECNSGDELVNATSATYMITDEVLQIDVGYWWAPEEGYQIDVVRLYLNANSTVTVNYCYFADEAGVVTSDAYNMRAGGSSVVIPDPVNLMLPDTLNIVDRTKSGSYTYNNGMLTVESSDANGFEVAFNVNKAVNVAELHRWLISVDSDVRFDIEMLVTTSDGDRTFSLRDDFYPEFTAAPDGDYLPAFSGSAGLDFYSCYTYNNIAPADGISTIKAVTVRLGGVGTTYVNSVQMAANDALTMFTDTVYKTDSSQGAVDDTIVLDSAVYPISGGIVSNVSVGTVAQMKAALTSSYTVVVYENGVAVADTTKVKTGLVIKVMDGTTEKASYTVSVNGDVNRDGDMSTTDARDILMAVVGMTTLDTTQSLSADMNGSGVTESSDARDLLMAIIGA